MEKLDNGGRALRVYGSPTLFEWGTIVDLTRGTGKTQYTDSEPCTTKSGVTFYGSSNASFCEG